MSFESIEFDDLHGLTAAVRAMGGVEAAIAGHSSVLVLARGAGDVVSLGASIAALVERGIPPRPAEAVTRHELAVDFSAEHAPDLPLLLARGSISRESFLARVATLELRARYLGFLPGFAYLEGWPEEWSLARRPEVRDRVPSGSLGVAGAMAGFYPGESPGGWNLVGRSSATFWDPRAARPNLVAAGDLVRLMPGAFAPEGQPAGVPELSGDVFAELLSPGVVTVVTGAPDASRYAHGIAPGGAFDVPALRLANRLAGNDDGAALLECAAVGPRLRFVADAEIAIAGATVDATVDGARVPMRTRLRIARGATLELGPVRGGMRALVAVRGGLADPAPRWSAKPARLERGSPLARLRGYERRQPLVPAPPGDRFTIECVAGPHDVDARLLDHIASRGWSVTPSLDRTGVRLASGAPPAELPALLPSCGMRAGTVQWHPGGELVVMGPDHPVTGGYLQPLTVPRRELWKVAQLAPGDLVRFVVRQVEGQKS